jgi:hypothetical protein
MTTREQRFANRQFALKHLKLIASLVDQVKVNDVHGSHITVFLGATRIEWWPGSEKWSDGTLGGKATHSGDLLAFADWIKSQPRTAAKAQTFQVIE